MMYFISEELLESLQYATSVDDIKRITAGIEKISTRNPPEKERSKKLLELLKKNISVLEYIRNGQHSASCAFHREDGDCDTSRCRFDLSNNNLSGRNKYVGCNLAGYKNTLEDKILEIERGL